MSIASDTGTQTLPLEKQPLNMTHKPSNWDVHILEHIEESQLLLSYAVRNGLELDKSLVTSVVRAKNWFEQGDWNTEREIEFWYAFNGLVKSVKPASLASLKSGARLSAFSYQAWTIIILLIWLLGHIYWIVGSIWYEYREQEIRLTEQIVEKLEIKFQSVAPEERVNDREVNLLTGHIDQRQRQIMAYERFLYEWWSLLFSWIEKEPLPPPTSSAPVQSLSTVPFLPPLPTTAVLIEKVKTVLQILQLYVLPLLNGLLGASVYVLRMLHAEMRSLTYVAESSTSYRLRIQLGMLSGLAISWFVGPGFSLTFTSPFSFNSLTPLVLAFLAGYSVDVLFAAMDRLISTFSADNDSKKGELGEKKPPL